MWDNKNDDAHKKKSGLYILIQNTLVIAKSHHLGTEKQNVRKKQKCKTTWREGGPGPWTLKPLSPKKIIEGWLVVGWLVGAGVGWLLGWWEPMKWSWSMCDNKNDYARKKKSGLYILIQNTLVIAKSHHLGTEKQNIRKKQKCKTTWREGGPGPWTLKPLSPKKIIEGWLVVGWLVGAGVGWLLGWLEPMKWSWSMCDNKNDDARKKKSGYIFLYKTHW